MIYMRWYISYLYIFNNFSNSKKMKYDAKKVVIRKLKEFAFEKLPKNWPLREILLSEEDELDIHVFLARFPIWLRLSRITGKEGGK